MTTKYVSLISINIYHKRQSLRNEIAENSFNRHVGLKFLYLPGFYFLCVIECITPCFSVKLGFYLTFHYKPVEDEA